jgi:hypothetical protein
MSFAFALPFLIAYAVVGLICGLIGASIARESGRDGAIWFVLCFATSLVGIIALAAGGRVPNGAASAAAAAAKRWRILVELDPELADAAAAVRAHGARYEEMLADYYLTVDDRGYLANARDRVLQIAAADEQRTRDVEQSLSQAERDFQRRIVSSELVGGVMIYRLNDGRVAADLADIDGKRLEYGSMDEMLRRLRLARTHGVTLPRYTPETSGRS